MALVLADRVRETTTTTGTGTVTLLGAFTGFQSFAVIGNGNTTYYTIADQNGTNWEVGIGTYTSSGTTLARTTVLASSNAGSLVNFPAGTKDVFVTYPAEKSVNQDASSVVNIPVLSVTSTTSTTPNLTFNASNSGITSGATISGSYLQTIIQNSSATAGASTNYVLSNNLGTDSTYYGEFGMNSSTYSSGTPADFFSLNNGIYFSGHDGDLTVGSGNGFKTYFAWGTTGQSAHVIDATGAIGLNTSITGTTNFGTSGQLMQSAGSGATPTWSSALTGLTIDNSVIGGTTPAAGTFTTLIGTSDLIRTTGNNLFSRSQTFNGTWSAGGANVTVTDNAVTAPDSTTTAAIILPTVTSGLHRILNASGTLTVYSGVTYTASVYAKANGYRYLYFNSNTALGATSVFDLQAGTVSTTLGTASITSVGSGWYRCSVTGTATSNIVPSIYLQINNTYATGDQSFAGDGTSSIYLWGAQLEIGSSATTYVVTTSAGIWNIPTLSFASTSASSIGLQSDGSLYVQPAGTGALQAQKTDSTATGGNARGANAVDWQTIRYNASQVASASQSVVGGGNSNTASGTASFVGSGYNNTPSAAYASVVCGFLNNASGQYSFIGGGKSNTSAGFMNFVGGGFTNSGTALSAITTQSGTMNATTAVTLSASNANIKVGQYITGTSIAADTYVAAISGTSLTLSQAASGSSTSTLSFYTPHGVVVGGGNNQATGAYSFIGGGGDAGTAANRNVASGDWSFVGGGIINTATNLRSVTVGGYNNQSTNLSSFVGGGENHISSGQRSVIAGGSNNQANGDYSTIAGGIYGTSRSTSGASVFTSGYSPIALSVGVSQSRLLVFARQTTDATATVLTTDINAASGANQVILPNNSAYYFRGEVIAGVTGGGNTSAWSIEGAIKRGAGVGTTAIVGTPVLNLVAQDSGASTWAIAITADTINGGLSITVTGQASTTIRWVAQIRTTEMTY
jgi:hypothetical protein